MSFSEQKKTIFPESIYIEHYLYKKYIKKQTCQIYFEKSSVSFTTYMRICVTTRLCFVRVQK